MESRSSFLLEVGKARKEIRGEKGIWERTVQPKRKWKEEVTMERGRRSRRD